MKQKNNNKKINKYLVGGKVNTYIEDPSDMLAKNDIMMAQAQLEAETNPLVQGLNILASLIGTTGNTLIGMGDKSGGVPKSSSPTKTAKYGGKVPVEVEGGEVAETPTGKFIEFKGPSHSDGGINVSLPPLTEIYSEKIKIEGKSLADRKKERENKEKRYSKQAKQGDALGENTLKRVKQANDIRDELDKRIQDIFSILKRQEDISAKKYEDGGSVSSDKVSSINPESIFDIEDPLEVLKNTFDKIIPKYKSPNKNTDSKLVKTNPLAPLEKIKDFKMKGNQPAMKSYGDLKKNKRTNISDTFGMTPGDLLGIAGNLYQSIAPYRNTLRSRAEDNPNVNTYKGFGQDALKANEEAMQYAQDILDNMMQDIELSSTSARRSLRNSASGINTIRALDIATESNKNKAQRDAYNQFAQMVMNNLQQKAQLENIQDEAVMRGEERKNTANIQDKDAFRTNIGQDKVNIGKGVTEIGKFLNKSKERDIMEAMLNSMYQYVGFDMSKGLTGKGGKSPEDMVKDGTWKYATDNPNTTDGRYSSLKEFKYVNGIK